MKTKIIISLLLIFTLLSINIVKADITPDTFSGLGDFNISGNSGSACATSQNVAFYVESLDRWYLLHLNQYSASDWEIAYSYSDSEDKTTWTSGGRIFIVISTYSLSGMPKPSYYNAWVYDNENEIGHYVRSSLDIDIVYYYSFTLNNETGALELSDPTFIDNVEDYHCKTVNIDIDVNGYPIIVTCEDGDSDVTERVNVFFSDTINGTGATWTNIHLLSHDGYNSINIIPTNETKKAFIILGALNSMQPIKYKLVEVGETANDTSAISISDYNAYRMQTSTLLCKMDMVSSSYNETHGAISYTRDDPYSTQVILFDFETVTTTEYNAVTSSGFYPVIVMDSNEFAVFTVDAWSTTQDIYGVEMHNATYEGFFNSSSIELMHDNIGSSNVNVRGQGGGSTFTNSLNEALYVVHSGDNIVVGFISFEGEYTEEEEEPPFEEREDPFDWGNVKYMLAVIVFFIITVFAIYIKKSVR